MPTPLMTRWAHGPSAATGGAVLVSVTDFRPHQLRDAPRVVAAGLRLRLGWYALQGAVALSLWSLPLERRSGSISIWTSEEELRGFVGLPAHVAIMRRYRDRGSLRSTTWTATRFRSREVLADAQAWITGRST